MRSPASSRIAGRSWSSGVSPLTVANSRLFILGLAVAAVVALSLTLRLTPLGRRIRAVVQNRDL